jgi:hypothetical protein
MASSSSTKTSKKIVVAGKPFVDFLQHLSFVCLNPKHKKPFKPQLLVLCPPLHLAHFGLMSTSLGHVEVVCSSKWHNWQQSLMLVEKDVLGPALPLVPFPKKLMKIPSKT